MKNNFKIHSIALCKNEADVISSCLLEAVKWSDYIYVYDGGSTDGTWEIVQSLNHPNIIPWKSDGKTFKEGLRAEVFNEFRGNSDVGDWWWQLNVDEFYEESPKEFLSRIPTWENLVHGIMAEYVLTDWEIGNLDFKKDFKDLRDEFRHYYVAWSEPRGFRYRKKLHWDENSAWPKHVGLSARKRILYKHYPSRSPEQLKIRYQTRVDNRNRGFEGWKEDTEGWRNTIRNSKDFIYDDGSRPLKYDKSIVPKHLEKSYIRIAKRIVHGLGVLP